MNRLANYVCMAAGFAILVFTISALTPGSALAQIVKAALVKNVDEKGRVPYSFTQFCVNNIENVCVVTTAAVPNNRRLVIEHISAEVEIGGGGISGYRLSVNGIETAFFAPTLVATPSFGQRYALNQPALVYAEAGQTTSVSLTGSTIATFVRQTVVLTGYLVDLTI